MNDGRRREPVQALLELIAEHLDGWLGGDDLALERLGEALRADHVTDDHLQAAILAVRSIAGTLPSAGVAALDETPGHRTQRMLSPLERESLSPEAWGFLLSLRRGGSLDAGQFERVLDRLTAIGERPVGIDLAREVATRVALRTTGRGEVFEYGAGDGEATH